MTDTATSTGPEPTPPQVPLLLTERAAKRIRDLAAADGGNVMLRLSISGGGCSGYQYGFTLDDTLTPEDRVVERDGAKLVVDETSLGLLGGAEIDFTEELVGSSFTVRNPNATSSCGCGNSFAI
ncbi:MAG: iron-sulfur cluster insertion protein ErpA [Gemmatimonas sp.]